jgi:uncharacterized protein (DUF433 family)
MAFEAGQCRASIRGCVCARPAARARPIEQNVLRGLAVCESGSGTRRSRGERMGPCDRERSGQVVASCRRPTPDREIMESGTVYPYRTFLLTWPSLRDAGKVGGCRTRLLLPTRPSLRSGPRGRTLVSNPEIMAGEIVFPRSRLTVRRIGELLEQGESPSVVLEDYPELSPQDLEFSPLFVKAYPPCRATAGRDSGY